ncbi:isochorismatase family protein [Saccharomonospora sp. NPDC006951]
MTANALLVIDAQESFRARPLWGQMSDRNIATGIGRLVDAARVAGDLVVWVLHTEPGTGNAFDPEQGHVRPLEGLVPREGEPVLAKTSINAFTTTNLQRLLTDRDIGHVTICGIRTEQCCETTARLASDLGYGVTFVLDATATNPIAHPTDDSRTLGTADIMERTACVLSGRFAEISTVEDVLARRTTLTGS